MQKSACGSVLGGDTPRQERGKMALYKQAGSECTGATFASEGPVLCPADGQEHHAMEGLFEQVSGGRRHSRDRSGCCGEGGWQRFKARVQGERLGSIALVQVRGAEAWARVMAVRMASCSTEAEAVGLNTVFYMGEG